MKTFLNILWVIGLLVWSSCFAMGFNYGHGDSFLVSLILLLAVLTIMGIDLYFLNKWANPQNVSNKKNAKTKEFASLGIYIVMVLLTMGGFAHFIAVQTAVKSEVRPLALERIQELRRVFGDEDREGSYLCYVSELAVTYRDAMKKNYADEGTVNLAVSEFEDEMMGLGAYDRLNAQAHVFLNDCEYAVLYWFPWNVTEYLIQLDENTIAWTEELVELSSKNEWVRETGEIYNLHVDDVGSFADLVINSNVSDYGVLSIVLIVVLQILILFSYIRSKDWSRSGPIKHKAKSGGPVVYKSKSVKNNKTEKQVDLIEEI